MKKYLYKAVSLFMFCAGLASCTTLKPYQRIYVNDPEMQMGTDAGKNFENYVHSIREGAAPAGAGKSGDGCGCK